MKIGVIGYARHALRHINIISQYADVVVYHPHKEGVCNDFEQILSCDGVVISSPTKTHIHYGLQMIGGQNLIRLYLPFCVMQLGFIDFYVEIMKLIFGLLVILLVRLQHQCLFSMHSVVGLHLMISI